MRILTITMLTLAVAFMAASCQEGEYSAEGGTTFKGFRGACPFAQEKVADPIRKMTHIHQFWGAEGVTNDSTYEDLRSSASGCDRPDDHSSYWAPQLKWNGNALSTNRTGAYFQSRDTNPLKTRPFPTGFKMIATEENGNILWHCDIRGQKDKTEGPPRSCAAGDDGIGLQIRFPECWDGDPEVGADGMHEVVQARDPNNDGTKTCPSGHPVQLPTLTLWPDYPGETYTGAFEVSMGDGMWGGPSTMHADVFIGMDTTTLVKECINDPARGEPRPDSCDMNRPF